MNDRKVNIRVPKSYYGIDEKVWEPLEEYIFTGFLINKASIFNNDFVFKTLNHNEIRNIMNLRKSVDNKFFKSAFIAHSLYIVMGKNVLYEREKNIEKLVGMILKMPNDISDKLVVNLNFLNKKASSLYPLVEIYSHESRSRYRWLYLKKVPINSVESTGIYGTPELGTNYCQQSWVAMNEIIDKKEDVEISWNNAKFIGSCFAGKGIISIDEQDKSRKNRELQDLDERRIKILNQYVYGISSDAGVDSSNHMLLPDGRKAVVEGRFKAETVEELAEQLSSALSGEKDWHDKVVDAHFNRARKDQDEFVKQRRRLAISSEFNNNASIAGGSKVLSKDDVDSYVDRMRSLMINNTDDRVSPPDIDSTDRSNLRGK